MAVHVKYVFNFGIFASLTGLVSLAFLVKGEAEHSFMFVFFCKLPVHVLVSFFYLIIIVVFFLVSRSSFYSEKIDSLPEIRLYFFVF